MALPNKVKKLLSQAEQLSDYRDCSSYFYKWLQNEFSKQPVSNLINARAEFIDRLLIKLFHDYDLAHESDLSPDCCGWLWSWRTTPLLRYRLYATGE